MATYYAYKGSENSIVSGSLYVNGYYSINPFSGTLSNTTYKKLSMATGTHWSTSPVDGTYMGTAATKCSTVDWQDGDTLVVGMYGSFTGTVLAGYGGNYVTDDKLTALYLDVGKIVNVDIHFEASAAKSLIIFIGADTKIKDFTVTCASGVTSDRVYLAPLTANTPQQLPLYGSFRCGYVQNMLYNTNDTAAVGIRGIKLVGDGDQTIIYDRSAAERYGYATTALRSASNTSTLSSYTLKTLCVASLFSMPIEIAKTEGAVTILYGTTNSTTYTDWNLMPVNVSGQCRVLNIDYTTDDTYKSYKQFGQVNIDGNLNVRDISIGCMGGDTTETDTTLGDLTGPTIQLESGSVRFHTLNCHNAAKDADNNAIENIRTAHIVKTSDWGGTLISPYSNGIYVEFEKAVNKGVLDSETTYSQASGGATLVKPSSFTVIPSATGELTASCGYLAGTRLYKYRKQYMGDNGAVSDYKTQSGRVVVYDVNSADTHNKIAYGTDYAFSVCSYDDTAVRYLAASPETEAEPLKSLLYGEHLVSYTKPVVICEGVFDVFAIGTGALATFGKKITPAQMARIGKYPYRIICLDAEADTQLQAQEWGERLKIYPGVTEVVCLDAPDPATASKHEIQLLRKAYGL